MFCHKESSLMKTINEVTLRTFALWENNHRKTVGKVFFEYIHSLFYPLRNRVKIHRLYISPKYHRMIYPIIDHITHPWRKHSYSKCIEPRGVVSYQNRRLYKVYPLRTFCPLAYKRVGIKYRSTKLGCPFTNSKSFSFRKYLQ